MAKLLLIALSLGISVYCIQDGNMPQSYTQGHEYVYHYETQIMSGLPESSKIYSGLKLVTKVHCQMIGPFKMKVKFRNPRLFKINGLLDNYDPTREMVPVEAFTEVLDDDAVRMKEDLTKPVSFSYTHGQVENVITEGADPAWSVNVKKGCLSLFEMNFNERQSLSPQVDVRKSGQEQIMYKVFEPCLAGECETAYRLISAASPDNTPSMQIEKVRNFENCMEKPVLIADMMNGRACEYCDADAAVDTFTAQSIVRCEMLGSPDQFVIVSAIAESMYAFIPFTENRGKIMAFTNQTLTLVGHSSTPESPIPDPSSPIEHRRPLWAMKSPRADKTRTGPWMLEKVERDELIQKAKKILTGIAKLNDKKVEISSDDLIKEMPRLLREMDKQGLKMLVNEVIKEPAMPQTMWKILFDMLPTVGTSESVDVLLDFMEKEKVDPNTAIISYIALSLIPQPDVPTVERFKEHIENYQLQPKSPELWRTAWLTMGSLGHKMIQTSENVVKELKGELKVLTIQRENSNMRQARMTLDKRIKEVRGRIQEIVQQHSNIKQQIIKMIEKLYNKKAREYRVLALKVIYNFGYEHFLPMLQRLAQDKNEPFSIRQEAVACFMRQSRDRVQMEKARSVLFPIYFDRAEPDDLRISAFLVAVSSFPSKPELEMVAKSLFDEPSLNVGSFVWDSLLFFSNTTTTCNCIKSLAHNATLAMRFAKRPEESFRYSTLIGYNSFDKTYNQGFSAVGGLIFSPEERLPRSIAHFMKASFSGKTYNLYGVHYRGKGLDTILASLYNSPDFPVLNDMVSPKFKRSVSDSAQRIQDIRSKLQIEPTAPIIPEGVIDFHLFDQNVFYFDLEPFLGINPESLARESPQSLMKILQKKVIRAVPKLIDMSGTINRVLSGDRFFYFPFTHTMIATETGLPLHLSYNWFGALKLQGDIKMNPSRASPAVGTGLSVVDLVFHFKPSGLLVINTDMLVDMKFYYCGVGTKVRNYIDAPLTMSASGDFTKNKVNLKITDMIPEMPYVYDGCAQTFVHRIPFLASQYPVPLDKKEIIVTTNGDMEVYSYEVGQDLFGIKYTIDGQWTRPKSPYVEQFPMCGKRTMYVKFDPVQSTELDIHFQHIREFKGESAREEEEDSWISDAIGWLFSKNGKQSRKANQPKANEGPSPVEPAQPANNPKGPFINLEQQELSIPYLEQSFMEAVQVLQTGLKCGMAITISQAGPQATHKVQFTTLYQMDAKGLNHFYTMDLRHFTPADPNNPWRMVTSTKLSFPVQVLEPSSLQNNEYQKQVQDQINKELARDESDFTAEFDLTYYVMVKSIKQLLLTEKRDGQRADIQTLINHILEQSDSPKVQALETLVQDQRAIEREAQEVRERPVRVRKSKRVLQVLSRLMEQTQDVQEKLKAIMSDASKIQRPQTGVMVQYIIVSQIQTLEDLERMIKTITVVLSPSHSSQLTAQLQKLKVTLADVDKDCLKMTLGIQAGDRAINGVNPSEMMIHKQLTEVEKKLVTCLQNNLEPESFTPGKTTKDPVPELQEIARLTEGLIQKINDHLEKFTQLDRQIRVKMAEVLLQIKQSTWVIEKVIAGINARTELQRPLSATPPLQKRRVLLELKFRLDGQVEALARRILLAATVEKEKELMTPAMSPQSEEALQALNTIAVKQLQLFEKLSSPKEEDRLSEAFLHKAVEVASQLSQALQTIVSKEINHSFASWKLSPVLIKGAIAIADQLETLDLVDIALKEKLVQEAASNGNTNSIRALQKAVIGPIENTISSASVLLHGIDRQARPYQDLANSQRRPSSTSSLVRRAVKVDAQLLKIKSDAQRLSEALSKAPSEKWSEPAMVKEQLYQTIRRISELQDEVESLHKSVGEQLAVAPGNEHLQELGKTLENRLEQLHNCIQTIEQPLKQRASVDTSLLQPLQELQKVKDRLQRYQHSSLQAQLLKPSQSRYPEYDRVSPAYDMRQPKGQPEQFPDQPAGQPDMPMDQISSMRGEATITFGPEGGEKKTISFKLLGRKSLQQLLWERDQILPAKQDHIVTQYHSAKHYPNDKTTLEYRIIKSQLNSYRHMHVFCAYQESIPWTLKNYMFRVHQNIKYFLHDQVFVSLPMADSPISNKFEISMDFDRDNQWTSMRIDTVNEITRVDFLQVPAWLREAIFPTTSSVEENLISQYVGDSTESCHVSPRSINTFDRRRLSPGIESQPCESVLAMDCSPNHEFVVTRQPSSAGTPKISILTKQDQMDIIKEKSGITVVKHNGHILDLSQHPAIIDSAGASLHISQINKDRVLLMVPSIGVYVSSDGERAGVRVSRYHKGKMCGLCGNMDGALKNDLTGPRQVAYPESRSMASTYLIPSGRCDPRSLQKDFKVPEIRRQSKMEQPLLRTDVIEPEKGGQSQTCFSTTPVRHCPPNTVPHQEKQRTVNYYCMRSGRRARALKKEAEARVLKEMMDKSASESAAIMEPESCIKS